MIVAAAVAAAAGYIIRSAWRTWVRGKGGGCGSGCGKCAAPAAAETRVPGRVSLPQV